MWSAERIICVVRCEGRGILVHDRSVRVGVISIFDGFDLVGVSRFDCQGVRVGFAWSGRYLIENQLEWFSRNLNGDCDCGLDSAPVQSVLRDGEGMLQCYWLK